MRVLSHVFFLGLRRVIFRTTDGDTSESLYTVASRRKPSDPHRPHK
jgi:hypothetical protein